MCINRHLNLCTHRPMPNTSRHILPILKVLLATTQELRLLSLILMCTTQNPSTGGQKELLQALKTRCVLFTHFTVKNKRFPALHQVKPVTRKYACFPLHLERNGMSSCSLRINSVVIFPLKKSRKSFAFHSAYNRLVIYVLAFQDN